MIKPMSVYYKNNLRSFLINMMIRQLTIKKIWDA